MVNLRPGKIEASPNGDALVPLSKYGRALADLPWKFVATPRW